MASGRYGVTLKELRELMECRGAEGIARVRDHYGGVHGLANKLNSSEENGEFTDRQIFLDRFRDSYPTRLDKPVNTWCDLHRGHL